MSPGLAALLAKAEARAKDAFNKLVLVNRKVAAGRATADELRKAIEVHDEAVRVLCTRKKWANEDERPAARVEMGR